MSWIKNKSTANILALIAILTSIIIFVLQAYLSNSNGNEKQATQGDNSPIIKSTGSGNVTINTNEE